MHGVSEHDVHVFFLDTAVSDNTPWDQTLTDCLYGGDPHYRLCQEIVFGIGGIRMLKVLGYNDIQAYHLNEGHSALLTLGCWRKGQRDGAYGRLISRTGKLSETNAFSPPILRCQQGRTSFLIVW